MTQAMHRMLSASLPWLVPMIGVTVAVAVDPGIGKRERRAVLWMEALLLALLAADAALFLTSAGQPAPRGWPTIVLRALPPVLAAAAAGLIVVRFRAEIREAAVLLVSCALVLGASAADLFAADGPQPVSYALRTMIGCLPACCIWLHLQLSRRHERELIEHLQAEQRIRIMVSQIQPHFLFNTLSTIQALCRIDPEKASDTVEKFGQYLRQNIDSLNRVGLIPFEKEIEHTRIYAEIEQIRFPSTRITYELEDTDFTLPALTVQPLVENAIRHGVRIRSRGEVAILTRREEGAHVIVIRDNGRGFDVEQALNADSSHIGIRNVRDRIEQMCGGSLGIESRIGEGTTVTIRIPAGKETR